MKQNRKRLQSRYAWWIPFASISLLIAGATFSTMSGSLAPMFTPGNLVVSRSVYQGTASTVTVGQKLPPVCPATAKKSACVTAVANGTYPTVFNNAPVDGSFGVTAPIYLDQLTTTGALVSTLAVPTASLVTSFSSKSEIALNLSQDGSKITFMGYAAPVNALDVSNSNTPSVVDPTNPVGGTPYSRVIATVDAFGNLTTTLTNAYSGNNGRAAILANGNFYLTGNAGNGSNPQPLNVDAAAGAQIVVPGSTPLTTPENIGFFSITQVPNANGGQLYPTPDKLGKDDNFRGLTIFNNTMYVTKGSGGNGINTVYQIGNAGQLPTLGDAPNEAITILPGFTTVLAANTTNSFPFGIWFANSTTLYVADEGDGTIADAGTDPYSGLQKWSWANGAWQLDYVLQQGLNLGVQYAVTTPVTVPPSTPYPNPATDGLRNLTGRVNNDGTVTIWAVTSTVSTAGDQGADPNMLVMITDKLANTTPAGAAGESFTVIDEAPYGQVLRGVSFTPGTPTTASFVGTDTATQGNWVGHYGIDGQDIAGSVNNPPGYATISLPTASTYVWTTGSDPRFLKEPAPSTTSIASAFYGNWFTVNVNATDSNLHQLALYLLDEDTNARSETITIADAQSGRVLDTRSFSNFHNGVWGVWNVQGDVLIEVQNTGPSNAVIAGIFLGGTTAPAINDPTVTLGAVPASISLITPLTATATATAPATIDSVQYFANGEAISGLLTTAPYSFSWPTTTLPNGSYALTAVATDSDGRTTTSAVTNTTINNTLTTQLTFVGTDTTTEGSWKGHYGAQGDAIFGDSFVLPGFALATFNGASTYIWTNATSATQALQELNGTGRIASAWDSPLSFTIDVNITDGNAHSVSLYLLDYDNEGRNETITVTDANVNNPNPITNPPATLDTRTLTNFQLGEYVTYNITGHVLITVTKNTGGSAAVSGLFFNN